MLPLKWTHGQFLEELVCDLLLPEQSKKHVNMLRQMDKEQLVASVNMTHQFSILAGATASVTEESNNDLSCPLGVRMYLEKTKTNYITRERMEGNFFKNRLDGLRHDWMHALKISHCQLCSYMQTHQMDKQQQEAWRHKQQNKSQIIRCLTCNVNLCN